jgi:hypothetical protein
MTDLIRSVSKYASRLGVGAVFGVLLGQGLKIGLPQISSIDPQTYFEIAILTCVLLERFFTAFFSIFLPRAVRLTLIELPRFFEAVKRWQELSWEERQRRVDALLWACYKFGIPPDEPSEYKGPPVLQPAVRKRNNKPKQPKKLND